MRAFTLQRLLLPAFLLLIVPGLVSGVRAQDDPAEEITVVGEGRAALENDSAAAEEAAIWDAKRDAVEQAVGFFLKSRTVARNFKLEDDEIQTRSNGFVRRWMLVPDSKEIEKVGNGKVLRLKVSATVALLPVIRRLADIRDVYDDLERPRLRIEIAGDSLARNAHRLLTTAFQKQGFEIASSDGAAEVVLSGRLELTPTVKLGDKTSPLEIGNSLAACRSKLSVQFVSSVSEETLLAAQAEGVGRSFQSDTDARIEATAEAASTLLEEQEKLLVERLLVRWARERQEGHTLAVRVSGLDKSGQKSLRRAIETMRGFLHIVLEEPTAKQYTLRFVTRLDTRDVRRRLSEFRPDNRPLTVRNNRGPLILCAVPPGPSRAGANGREIRPRKRGGEPQ